MNTNNIKLCRYCKYYGQATYNKYGGESNYPKYESDKIPCHRVPSEITEIDYVNGEHSIKFTTCKEERESEEENVCGKDGKYFKKRNMIKQLIK